MWAIAAALFGSDLDSRIATKMSDSESHQHKNVCCWWLSGLAPIARQSNIPGRNAPFPDGGGKYPLLALNVQLLATAHVSTFQEILRALAAGTDPVAVYGTVSNV
jgi:hypothetical protein